MRPPLIRAFVAAWLVGAGMVPSPALSAAPAAPESAVTLSTPVFSARRLPTLISLVVADAHLGTDLDRVMTDASLGVARERSCLVVGEAGRGVLHYARQPTLALIPASTMKVLTAAAALAQLGPETRFTTEVRAGSQLPGGALADMYLVGGGDPLLSTAEFALDGGYLGQLRRSTSVEALADKVVATGVRRIGRLVGDDSRYDGERLVPSWNPRYIANFDVTPLSALVINKGFASSNPPAVAISPPAHAASVLAGLLKARGVTVDFSGVGKAPSETPVLTSIESAPLREVVADILSNSDNMGAEMLVKELSARPGTAGTTAAGLGVLTSQLRGLGGLTAEELVTVDGSGLDRSDRLTCGGLQRVLAQAGDSGPLAQGLPVAGRNGTLFRRFIGTPAAGKVRAKTGSLEGVAGLAGFETAADGRSLSFALLSNDLPSPAVGLAVQDKVVTVLAAYPRAPAAGDLAPKPVVRAPA